MPSTPLRPAAGKLELYKVVVLGDGGVGKTALTIQLCLQHFVETYDPTIEDSYRKQVVIDGQRCMLEILDTAGQEEYMGLRVQWIRDSEAFLLVYSISSRSSFARIEMFHRQLRRVKEELLATAFTAHQDISLPIMLVGNKCDRNTEREVSTREGLDLARRLGVCFVETSAKNCINVEKAVYDLIRDLRRTRWMEASRANVSGTLLKRTLWGSYRVPISREERDTGPGQAKLLAGLVQSAKTNNEKALIAYIEAGAVVNGHSRSDGSPLHASSAAGHANIVNILLKSGAAVNALGPTGIPPLQLAASEGHLAVVRLLLHKGAIIDQTSKLHGTALMAAASRGRAEVVGLLLKARATVSISGGPYGNALQAAAWNGSPRVITHLLDAGADINARGGGDCTALQMAAFVGKEHAVEVLLRRGADITINAPGGRYGTALKAANDGGHFSAVTLLLKEGGKYTPDETEGAPGERAQTAEDDDEEAQPSTTDENQGREESPPTPGMDDEATSSMVQPLALPLSGRFSTLSSGIASPPVATQRRPQEQFRNSTTSLEHSSRYNVHAAGFSTIHDSPNAAVDIVFVHGLQGHPERTWTYPGAGTGHSSAPSLRRRLFRSLSKSFSESGSPVYWPYDLLAQSTDFANTRIMMWGYDTKVVEFFGNSDRQNISQHGNNLLVCLQQERKADPGRPLIFVCHSLGGIVVKVALQHSKNSVHQPQYLSVYRSTRGILFFGTPHGGARVADWGLIASNIVKCALQSPSQKVLRNLNPNSELLESLRKSFLQMLEDGHFSIHSFYETRAVGAYGLNTLVVPFESALVGHARREVSLGIGANHSEICKFSGIDDPGFRAAFGALQDYVREAASLGHEQSPPPGDDVSQSGVDSAISKSCVMGNGEDC